MPQERAISNMALGHWAGASFASNFIWGVLLIAVLGLPKWLATRKRKIREAEVEEELEAEPADQSAAT